MKHRRSVALPVLAVVLSAGLAAPAAAAPPSDREPDERKPADAGGELNAAAGEVCEFPVDLLLSGKSKTIDLPGGRTIVTSPGLEVTVRNASTGDARHYVITGAAHSTVLPGGDVVFRTTGRNLNLDPEAGFVLISGNFSYTLGPDGEVVEPLHGVGTVVDVCAELS